MSRKTNSGSHRKVDTTTHRKRRKKELTNRSVHKIARSEADFAERIRNEPPLKEMERTW